MRQRGGSEQRVKGRRANRPKTRKVSTTAPSIANLQKKVGKLTRELKKAREHCTSMRETSVARTPWSNSIGSSRSKAGEFCAVMYF
jgi:hypothetical protein